MDILTGEIEAVRITLPAVLDSANGGAVKTELAKAMSGGAAVEVDASAVDRISTPVLQLLTAAIQDGQMVRIDKPSAAFMTAAATIGATERLGLKGE